MGRVAFFSFLSFLFLLFSFLSLSLSLSCVHLFLKKQKKNINVVFVVHQLSFPTLAPVLVASCLSLPCAALSTSISGPLVCVGNHPLASQHTSGLVRICVFNRTGRLDMGGGGAYPHGVGACNLSNTGRQLGQLCFFSCFSKNEQNSFFDSLWALCGAI